MEKVPIKVSDPAKPREMNLHDHLVDLVKRIIGRYETLGKSKNPQERTSIQREINSLDNEIDRVVYQLYDLTPSEISILERDNFKSAPLQV